MFCCYYDCYQGFASCFHIITSLFILKIYMYPQTNKIIIFTCLGLLLASVSGQQKRRSFGMTWFDLLAIRYRIVNIKCTCIKLFKMKLPWLLKIYLAGINLMSIYESLKLECGRFESKPTNDDPAAEKPIHNKLHRNNVGMYACISIHTTLRLVLLIFLSFSFHRLLFSTQNMG